MACFWLASSSFFWSFALIGLAPALPVSSERESRAAAGTVFVAGNAPPFGATTTTGGCGGFNTAAAAAGDSAAPGAAAGVATLDGVLAGVTNALGRSEVKAGGSGGTVFLSGSGARNGSGVRGSAVVTPEEVRARISGVIITTSSV